MADWKANWQDAVDESTRRLVERAVLHLDDLVKRYEALAGAVAPSGGGGVGVGRRPPGPGVPIRVDVVDLARDVEAFAKRYSELVAGSLRAGSSNTRSTVAHLGYVAEHLGTAAIEDPSLARDVEEGAAKLRWRARRMAGEVARPFPVDVDCPACGLMSLWVHPGLGVVKCGVEDCGSEWAVGDLTVPVWSASRVDID